MRVIVAHPFISTCWLAKGYGVAGDKLHWNKASVNWTVRRYWWAVVVCDALCICGWLKVPRSRRCPKLSPLVLDIFDFPAGRIGRLCAQQERGLTFLSPVRLEPIPAPLASGVSFSTGRMQGEHGEAY